MHAKYTRMHILTYAIHLSIALCSYCNIPYYYNIPYYVVPYGPIIYMLKTFDINA